MRIQLEILVLRRPFNRLFLPSFFCHEFRQLCKPGEQNLPDRRRDKWLLGKTNKI